MTRRIQQLLEKVRHRLDTIYGDRLVAVILYGSYARGDTRPDSDVDVMVILRGPVEPYTEIKRMGDLRLNVLDEYGVFVSFQPYSEEYYRTRRTPLMINVRAEGIEV